MDKKNKKLLFGCGCIIAIVIIVLIALGLAGFFMVGEMASNLIPGVGSKDASEVVMTPSQIEDIRRIGQWEFMSLNDEEMVDTIRTGFFSDDHLVRIYYGTLRLGIDLREFSAERLSVHDDSVVVQLPAVTLLDPHFIDEARTQSFHESGSWSNSDRCALYERAQHKMIARCVTPETLEATRQLAETQIRRLLLSMGFEKVCIRFD